MNIKDCITKRFLIRALPDEELVRKELKEAEHDLNSAKSTLVTKDFKWCIVKSYYSMFHAGKALLFKLGYQEKKHIAILIVLEDLNKKGKIELKYVSYFNTVLHTREDADYHYIYGEDIAKHNVNIAKEFIKRMKELIEEL